MDTAFTEDTASLKERKCSTVRTCPGICEVFALVFQRVNPEGEKEEQRSQNYPKLLCVWAKRNIRFQKMTSLDHENWRTAGLDAHDYER